MQYVLPAAAQKLYAVAGTSKQYVVGKHPTCSKCTFVARENPCGPILSGSLCSQAIPEKKGASTWARDKANSAVRGNVSTYRLNTADIEDVIGGFTMPPLAIVLSATIGVTFVGPKNVSEKTMPDFLRVRRRNVLEALKWLKRNNPLYQQVTISDERLEELPIDGIPQEIMDVVKYSADTELLDSEHSGYTPDDVEDEAARYGPDGQSPEHIHAESTDEFTDMDVSNISPEDIDYAAAASGEYIQTSPLTKLTDPKEFCRPKMKNYKRTSQVSCPCNKTAPGLQTDMQ